VHPDGGDPGTAEAIKDLVSRHRPADPHEAEAQQRFLAALNELDRPCDEHADPVHVTASAVVAGERGTLLHLHRRLGRWLQPGGHIDEGETPWDAARRETLEETGLSAGHPSDGPYLLQLDVHEAALGHTHLDMRYLLLGPDADPSPPPEESQDVRWYRWEEAEELADDSLCRALREARRAWEVVA
jgi:8-oxo-dGTP pyrophosphatase MutT (NUDIX family)